MTFAIRQINLQFSQDNEEPVNLTGLKCQAVILNPSVLAKLQLRVWGMTLDQMNRYSNVGSNATNLTNRTVTVSAGIQGQVLAQIFSGNIISSYIDFSSVPDVCFVVEASTGAEFLARGAASTSYPGSVNAEDVIRSLASSIDYGFTNGEGDNAAHAIIQNQQLNGSVIQQMQTIARASAIPMVIENNTVSIWANDGFRDGVSITLNEGNGMVGYPTYWAAGFAVKSEYNPMISIGRQITISSIIPKANGTFAIQYVTHELSTFIPDGPWFTTARLSPPPYVPNN